MHYEKDEHYTKWKKPDTKVTYDSYSEISRIGKSIEMESRSVVAGKEEGAWGVNANVPKLDSGYGVSTILKITLQKCGFYGVWIKSK